MLVGTAMSKPLPKTEVQNPHGLSDKEFEWMKTLLARYQVQMKHDIYKDFKAPEILDFLFKYVYVPNTDRADSHNVWFAKFKNVFTAHGSNWETVRRRSSSKFMGAGKALLDSVGIMFRFYALTDQLDHDMLDELIKRMKGQDLLKLQSIPHKDYEAAFKTTDPGGGRRRLQITLADDLLEIVVTIAKSPMAMGGIQAALAMGGRFAPAGFKEVIPYVQTVMDEGLKVLKPYLNNAGPLRKEMLALEETYIVRVIGE
jgi:hypothetical protein